MLIKLAKAYSGKRPPGYSSIANRLALMHILAVVLTSTVGAVLLYSMLHQKLDRSARNELQSEIVAVRTLLSAPRGVELLKQEMDARLYSEESRGIYLRVVDRQGGVVMESPGMREVLPAAAFPSPAKRNGVKYRSVSETVST